jgi:hypothetical protein
MTKGKRKDGAEQFVKVIYYKKSMHTIKLMSIHLHANMPLIGAERNFVLIPKYR